MSRFFITAAILVTVATRAPCHLVAIDVAPLRPVTGEQFMVTISGYLPTTAWSLLGNDCHEPMGNQLLVTVATYDCFGRECTTEGYEATPYTVTCAYEVAAPGAYTITVTEIWDSRYTPGADEMSRTIEVSGSVEADLTTWSALKALYR